MNKNTMLKLDIPPPRYSMLGLMKLWIRKKRMCTATTMP